MKKTILTIILQVLTLAGIQAQVITLDECVALARSNYPAIAKLQIIKMTEACDFANASKTWLPSVKLNIGAGWVNHNFDITDLYSNTSDEMTREYYRKMFQEDWQVLSPSHWVYSGSVEVSQNIYDGGKSSAMKNEASARARLQETEVGVSLEVIEDRVEELYFSILLLNERKKQMDLQMEVLQRNMKKMTDLQQSGNGSVLSVKIIQAEIITLNQQVHTLKGNLSAYQHSLSLFVGKDLTNAVLCLPPLPNGSIRDIYNSPAMKLLDNQTDLANANIDLLNASLKPKVLMVGNFSYGYPGYNIFRTVVSHTPLLDISLGVKVVWDLTPFYTKKNNIQKIRNEIRMIDIDRQSLLFNSQIDNAIINSQIAEIKNSLQQDEELLSLRSEIREIEESRLDNGMIDIDTFLTKVSEESDAAIAKSIHTIQLLLNYRKLK